MLAVTTRVREKAREYGGKLIESDAEGVEEVLGSLIGRHNRSIGRLHIQGPAWSDGDYQLATN